MLHRRQLGKILIELFEQRVPTLDESTFILEIDEFQFKRNPVVLDLSDKLLKSHLALGLSDDTVQKLGVLAEAHSPHTAERQVLETGAKAQFLDDGAPVSLFQRITSKFAAVVI